MENRQFDDMVRRRIETEDISMSKLSETRLAQALQQPEVKQKARRLTMRTVVLAALVLALLCGAAVAAVTWSSREYLTRVNEDGTTEVNETLLEYVQPVGKVFENDAIKVNVVDAIFDGHALVLTWTTQNKMQDEVYLLCDVTVNDTWAGQGSYSKVDELFLKPGEIVSSGFSARVDETVGMGRDNHQLAETCDVNLAFTLLKPNSEVVEVQIELTGDETEAEYDRVAGEYTAKIDSLIEEGKVVVEPDGVIVMGSKYPHYEEGMTRADIYTASGLLTETGSLNAAITVAKNAEVKSALADGQPVEKDNGDYILRVVKAELTPNSATFLLERIFPTKEAAEKYANFYRIKHGPYWGFDFVDEEGDIWWAGNSGGGSTMEAPEEQADGTWMWDYEASMTDILRMPTEITVIPYRDNLDMDPEGEYNPDDMHIEYPDEAVRLEFK